MRAEKVIYHDIYGGCAVIRNRKNGTAELTVRTCYGDLVCRKTYQTGRGARIAMGKLSDGWTHTTTKWI